MAAGEPDGGAGDPVLADLIELGGAGLAVIELGPGVRWSAPGPGAICVGIDRHGAPHVTAVETFDILLTAAADAPAPWVRVDDLDQAVEALRDVAARQPVAAAVGAQVLRATLHLSFKDALALESLGYSMLLASGGFRAWRAETPVRQRPEDDAPRVLIEDAGGTLNVRLNRPARRNAFDAAMRDALADALTFALEHPDAPGVVLSGNGLAFSAGGDLDEFGQAADVGRAHLIRTLRSPAALVHALGDRITARLHGACVGAGIEVPAAAGRVTAAAGSSFRLPEVSMGLIPGAGGTASIPRRIGRHRAAWMAISGADVDLATALAWGLVDAEGAP
jgi:hypothetical protein